MDSILLLNKPVGISSAGVLNQIKKQWNIPSLGHAGTLDPFAQGLLIVGRERATKLLPYFQNLPKEYIATVQLGIQTDTDDITGEVIDTKSIKCSLKEIENILKNFLGEIKQIPPKFSALKINGERAYRLAREKKDFIVQERTVYIDTIELLDFLGEDQTFTIRICCSTGTYIRALARDLGIALNTVATLKSLERSVIGHVKVEDAVLPEDIVEDSFLSIPKAFSHLSTFFIKEEFYKQVCNGSPILGEYIKQSGNSSEGYSPSYYLLWRNSPSQEFLGVVDNRNSRFLYKAL